MKVISLRVSLLLCMLVAVGVNAQSAGKDVSINLSSPLPSLAPLVDAVKGAVVNIDVQKPAMSDAQLQMLDQLMPGRRGNGETPLSSGTGSGFVVDPKGLIVTNNHVVEGAVSIRVRFEGGKAYDAEIVGRDPLTDVAVVKLKGKVDALPTVTFGDSKALKPGDWAVAIGNPFGLSHSVSLGIISALERNLGLGTYDEFLQTDAAINPGNSGGPLFNLKGQVIGMNTLKSDGGGVGFAVPIHLISALLPQLEKDGVVKRGYLGVVLQDVTEALRAALKLPAAEGALVSTVNPGSPAEAGGLKEDDVVLAIDNDKVTSRSSLTRMVALKRPESTVTLKVLRDSKPLEIKLKIAIRPDLEKIGDISPRSSDSKGEKSKFGVVVEDVDRRLVEMGLPAQGALIAEVLPGSVAERAGLTRGMVVTEVNKKPIRSRTDLINALKNAKSGESLLLRITQRGGKLLVGVQVP
jgi:serine protease Do